MEINENALFYATVMTAAGLSSHLFACAYIAVNDLSGRWDNFRLKETPNKWTTYTSHLPSLFFDFIVLLWPSLYIFVVIGGEKSLFARLYFQKVAHC